MKMENERVTYMREAAANEHAESKMPSKYYNLGAAVAAEMMHGFLFIVGTILAIEVIEVARALSSKT